jgi:hypothetical protein
MSFVFKHPNYYKKLKASQEKKVISPDSAVAESGRAPGPKLQATSYKLPGPRPISEQNKGLFHRRQAASSKQQASGNKRENND